MTRRTWNWLPDSALAAPPVLAVVDETMAHWSARWFATHRLQRGRLAFVEAAADLPVVARTPRLAVLAMEAWADLVVGHALDIDVARLELGDGDRAVVGSLRDQMFQDLAERFDRALTVGTGDGPESDLGSGKAIIEFADDAGRKCLVLETSRAVLAEVRRSALPTAPRRPGRLEPIRQAIADSPVRLFAHVGSAAIALPDARRLAPGDVVILDRALDQPFDLVTGDGGPPVACADLEDAASPRSLRLRAVDRRDRP